MKHFAFIPIFVAAFFYFYPLSALHAEGTLPESVQTQLRTSLAEVGGGTYRKFGFSVYHATLWAPGGLWDATKPYALELRYTRGLSKDTLVDTVIDDIRDQGVADEDTLAYWGKILNDTLPEVEDGDTLIGLSVPRKKSQLFFNGTKIASIDDQALSQAFFNIWLGATADEDLRDKLLGHER